MSRKAICLISALLLSMLLIVPTAFAWTVEDEGIYASAIAMDTKIRRAGKGALSDWINAKVGDLVEFRVEYANASSNSEIHHDATMQVILEDNLELLPDTLVFTSNGTVEPLAADSDALKKGVCIGDYAPHETAALQFTAKVIGQGDVLCWASVNAGEGYRAGAAKAFVREPIVLPPLFYAYLIAIVLCIVGLFLVSRQLRLLNEAERRGEVV